MQTIINRKKGVLSVAAVVLLVAVCLSPMLVDESDAAANDSTIYLRPGDTYTWTPTFNIDSSRIELGVCVSSDWLIIKYYQTSTLDGVTATVNDDKSISISVSPEVSISSINVGVKATTTSGVTQEATAAMIVKIINPVISQGTVNTYQGGTVSVQPTISNTDIDSKTVTYSMSGAPDGLKINASTGEITGTVPASAEAKTYSVKVTGTIATQPTQTFSTTFSMVVAKSMGLTAPGDQYTAYGTAKDIALEGTNTTEDTVWEITSGSASGISMATDPGTSGKITVAKTVEAGIYSVGYSATNPTSGQTVTGTVNLTVGSVGISSISSTGGRADAIDNGSVNIWAVQGTAADFTVSTTSNPTGLTSTLSMSKNIDGITVDGQKISVAKTVEAGTYTFTITETQASTGAVSSVDVTLVVDLPLQFTNAVTSGSLAVKGAGA